MGTRSLTRVNTSDGKRILNLYSQFDGYPDAHGKELFAFLDGMVIVNGFNDRTPKIANGEGCLSAQLVAHFKKGTGGFYIYPVDVEACGQDYEYVVTVDLQNKSISVSCQGYRKELFSGSVKEFGEFCEKPNSDED